MPKTNPPKNCQKLLRPEAEKWCLRQKWLRPEAEKWRKKKNKKEAENSEHFCQLEPVGSTELDLLYSSLSSKHWDNCINSIIILDNDHRFKEDPEHGQMLKRMWNGDLTTEDRKRICALHGARAYP